MPNPNAMNNILSRKNSIRKLMQMDSTGELNKYKESALSEGKMSFGEDGVNVNMPTSQKAVSIPANFQVESAIASHPHLPKEIIESFSKNPPSEGTTSVLDGYVDLDAPQMSKNITEAKVMPTHSTPMMQSNGIDYSLIKSIIDESVRKYVGALSKKIITESRNANASNLQLFSVGNHLTFVNENGDVYKAQLQYVKNIKENKKTL